MTKFQKGDRVRRITIANTVGMPVGSEWTVIGSKPTGYPGGGEWLALEGYEDGFYSSLSEMFELVSNGSTPCGLKVGDRVRQKPIDGELVTVNLSDHWRRCHGEKPEQEAEGIFYITKVLGDHVEYASEPRENDPMDPQVPAYYFEAAPAAPFTVGDTIRAVENDYDCFPFEGFKKGDTFTVLDVLEEEDGFYVVFDDNDHDARHLPVDLFEKVETVGEIFERAVADMEEPEQDPAPDVTISVPHGTIVHINYV